MRQAIRTGALAGAVVFAVALGSVNGLANQVPPASIEITGLQRLEHRVSVSVAVLDSASNPIPGLTATDFTVQVDGRTVAAEVSTGLDTALPLGIVLTVDTSGSMQGQAIESSKQAILPLIAALQPSDQAALITFANQVIEAVPLTGDQAALSSAVNSMNAAGNTALYAGVVRASEVVAAAPQPRRAVVLLSDGEDFGAVSGGITGEQALDAARGVGVPFFVVGLGAQVDQPFLTSLARDTGGQYFAAADPEQLAQLYGRISDRLRQQYTVVVQLPADFPGGGHRLSISTGGVTATSAFETEVPSVSPVLMLNDPPSAISELTRFGVTGVPQGATVQFEVDGERLEPLPGGREVEIDPYALAPGQHTLRVLVVLAGESDAIQHEFTVEALPPLLLAPREIPNLRPGDLVRLTIQAQPGAVTVRFLIDGEERAVLTSEPFEFVLPTEDYASGAHELSVSVESAAGSAGQSWQFQGPPGEPGPNYAAYILLVLAVLVALAIIGYSLRRALAWYRARPEPIDVTGVGEQLAAWSELRRGRGIEVEATPVATTSAATWGTISVVSGPDEGKEFALTEDSELVGRGKFCTIRLSDSSVEEAHFVISRDGRLNASTPTARVEVDGEVVRAFEVRSDARVRVGDTALAVRIDQLEPEGKE